MPCTGKNGYDPAGHGDGAPPAPDSASVSLPVRPSGIRLLLIPGLICLVWIIDTFILEGSLSVYTRMQPFILLLYTLVTNVFLGILIPVAVLRPAFLSGAVNMFQLGFRSARRTAIAVLITTLSCYLILIAFNPSGTERLALLPVFFLMLPQGIASVMVCWVLLGTHVQAYTREHGAAVSILAGVSVTGLFFAFSLAATGLHSGQSSWYLLCLCIGVAAAIFFFAVRDIPSSAILVTTLLCPAVQDAVDPTYTQGLDPAVLACAGLSIVALAACYLYLSKRFITVEIPVRVPVNKRN